MNAYEKAQSLGLTGADAEIVSVLQTLTVHNIKVDRVADFLRKTGLWYRSGPTSMAGDIQKMIDERLIPQEFEAQLGILWSAVFGDGAIELLTTDPQHAALTFQIVGGLAAAAPESAQLVDAFYALDGGRPWKDLTVEQFADERKAADNAAEAQKSSDQKQAWIAIVMNDHLQPASTDKASIVAALAAAIEHLESL